MICQRGTKGTYQSWADAVDDQSYNFDSWLPYFKKSVQFTAPDTTKRAKNATTSYDTIAFIAGGGPSDVSYGTFAGPFSSFLDGAFKEIGIQDATDFDSGSLMGSQYCSSTFQPTKQARESSQTAFLTADVMTRKNFKVSP